MIHCKRLNLNGLELDGSIPITPRTQQFLFSKGLQVEQSNGKIKLAGSGSISKQEVEQFLATKRSAPTPKI